MRLDAFENPKQSVPVLVVVVAISPFATTSVVSPPKALTISISIAVLKLFDWSHPAMVTVSSLLESPEVDVPRIILMSFVATLTVPIVVPILVPIFVSLLRITTVVIAVVAVLCKSRTIERCHCSKCQSDVKSSFSTDFLHDVLQTA